MSTLPPFLEEPGPVEGAYLGLQILWRPSELPVSETGLSSYSLSQVSTLLPVLLIDPACRNAVFSK
jgi:hypothetical protein